MHNISAQHKMQLIYNSDSWLLATEYLNISKNMEKYHYENRFRKNAWIRE
jgi:hypothetical protein